MADPRHGLSEHQLGRLSDDDLAIWEFATSATDDEIDQLSSDEYSKLEQRLQEISFKKDVLPETQEFTGESPETTKGEGLLASVLDWAMGQSMVPPASKGGQLARPEASQADAAALEEALISGGKGAGTLAAEVGATYLAPQYQVPRHASRAVRYGAPIAQAAMAGLLAEGGHQAAEEVGLAEQTEFLGPESRRRVLLDTAMGGGLGLASEAVKSTAEEGVDVAKRMSQFSDDPIEVARRYGAAGEALNPEARKYVVGSMKKLKAGADSGDEFAKKVMKTADDDVSKALKMADEKTNEIGQKIGAYKSNEGKELFVDVKDIRNHPVYEKMTKEAVAGAGEGMAPSLSERAMGAIGEFDAMFPAGGKVDMETVITAKQSLDRMLKTVHEGGSTPVPISKDDLYKLSNMLREIVNEKNPALKELNEQFHMYSTLRNVLGKGVVKDRAVTTFGGAAKEKYLPKGSRLFEAAQGVAETDMSGVPRGAVQGESLIRALLGTEQ